MPDLTKFSCETLVEIVSMTWPCDQESQQGIFRREITGVLRFFVFYTHSVSICAL